MPLSTSLAGGRDDQDLMRKQRWIVRLILPLLLLAITAIGARADVQTVGDVDPARNPFDPLNFPGLPVSGNFIIPGPVDDPWDTADRQPAFEGEREITVGRSSFGAVLISGNTALRYQDLIIGDRLDVNGQLRTGTGVVRISGFGALYNNDPTILPFGLDYATFGSKRDAEVGYDVYVGRWGTGTLEISAGGRAEIQDAVIVGDNAGANGSIIVDGFDSFLGSGGFATASGEPHQMLVGRRGTGFMTITNGGTVLSESLSTGGGGVDGPVGAVIGSDTFNFEGTSTRPRAGGQGTVTVSGIASKWIIGGSLQVGGFHNSNQEIGAGGGEDIEGDDAEYRNEVGRGTLRVNDGGFVSVRPAIDADEQIDLLLAIGRFGRVELAGGVIAVGGSLTTSGTVSDRVKLINDGVITGSGRIGTGIFRNRYHGEVRVGAGQHLIIDSSSEFRAGGTLEQEPLLNFGVIQAFGTADSRAELEFERAPNTENQPIRPFRNMRVERPAAAPPLDFYGGLISAQHSILRFRSGIENEGMMAFTAGNNYVTGNVLNMPGPDPAFPLVDPGIITVSGPGTKVTFENDLTNLGVLNVSGGAVVEVLARHSFITAGEFRVNLNPTHPTQVFSAGDAGITGKLLVSLTGFAPGSLSIGDTFEIISVAGELGGVDLSDPLKPQVDLTAPPLFTQIVTPNLSFLGLPPSAVLLPIYTPNSVLLSIMSAGGAIGPDFNGDGIIDHLDLAIWQSNVGITMGASVLQGDADGDGDVDGDDFLIWQRNVGQPPPWNGAGSGGSGGLGAQVPEPASLALLLSGGLLALARRRKRVR